MLLNYNSKEAQNNLDLLQSELKLVDFGLATSSDTLNTVLMSPLNIDPIILKIYRSFGSLYDKIIDIWSLGFISYYLFTGETPFQANNNFMLLDEIEKGKIKIPINLSVEAVSFLLKMFPYHRKKKSVLLNY